MALVKALVQALHVLAWGAAYGALTYNYFRLDSQARSFSASDDEYEAIAALIGEGLGRWIRGSAILAISTGVVLAILERPTSRQPTWWVLIAMKSIFAVALLLVQSYVGRVLWPRRARADRNTWPTQRRMMFRAAFLVGFCLLMQLILGTVVHVMASANVPD